MPKSTRKRRSKSKTGYFGVVKQLNGGKYQAYISIGKGKKKYIGSSYKTAKQAAQAHDKEAIKLRRPFSKLNFPEKTPDGYTPRQQALVSRNTVGYRGVSKRGKNYHAQTKIGGKTTGLGNYDTAKEAAIAYDRAVLKANRPTTLLNFPDMVHNLDVEPKRKNIKRSSTGYTGVNKDQNKFRAIISIGNGKQKHLGRFDTAIKAAFAYDQAAIKAGKKKLNLTKIEFGAQQLEFDHMQLVNERMNCLQPGDVDGFEIDTSKLSSEEVDFLLGR